MQEINTEIYLKKKKTKKENMEKIDIIKCQKKNETKTKRILKKIIVKLIKLNTTIIFAIMTNNDDTKQFFKKFHNDDTKKFKQVS